MCKTSIRDWLHCKCNYGAVRIIVDKEVYIVHCIHTLHVFSLKGGPFQALELKTDKLVTEIPLTLYV